MGEAEPLMFQEPPPNDYDFHFRCFGFHVRVHPFFWLAIVMLGARGLYDAEGQFHQDAGVKLLAWAVVLFVSILVHELGHSLTMRRFGTSSHIILYWLGGLAVPDADMKWMSQRSGWNSWQHILISLAGPLAGFGLAAITVAGVYLLGGRMYLFSEPPFFAAGLPHSVSRPLEYVIRYSLFINIFWGLVNLLPVYPLDGGQVSQELFKQADPWNGVVRSLWLSIYVAIGVGIGGWFSMQDAFIAVMFAILALNNYMMLQQLQGGGPGGRPW